MNCVCGSPAETTDGWCGRCCQPQVFYAPKTCAKCPVCEGKGMVPAGFYGAIGAEHWTVGTLTPEPCRSCNQTGVVWS